MEKLIVSAVVFGALAILVALNLNYDSTIDVFGAKIANVSVVAIAIGGFVR